MMSQNTRLFGDRSPDSDDQKGEAKKQRNEVLDAIKGLRDEMRLAEERNYTAFTKRFDALEQGIGVKITQLENQCNLMGSKVTALERDNDFLRARLAQIDRQQRQNNVKISGIDVNTVEEATTAIEQVLNAGMEETVPIKNIKLINTTGGKKIIGTCNNMEDKRKLMRSKRCLKTKEGKPVYVDNDLSKEDGEIYFKARKLAETLRRAGNRVKVESNRIQVGDEWRYYDKETDAFKPRETFRKPPTI